MGTGERVVVTIGLANTFVETHTLRRDQGSLDGNRAAAERLVEKISIRGIQPSADQKGGPGLVFSEVPVAPIVNFLTEFRNHPGVPVTDGAPIRRYIEEREDDELALWDVYLPSVGLRDNVLTDKIAGFAIQCQRRTAGKRSDPRTLLIGNRQRVSTRGIEKTGLSAMQRAMAEESYREHLATKDRLFAGQSINFPDWAYRAQRGRPLLVIHLLDVRTEAGDKMPKNPVVAWSISFPPTDRRERRVEYVVNTTWMREHYGDDLEEEEMLGDDR